MASDDPLGLFCEYSLAAIRLSADPAEVDRSSAVVHTLELIERAVAGGPATPARSGTGTLIRLPLSSS
jgi:hypothetical protein